MMHVSFIEIYGKKKEIWRLMIDNQVSRLSNLFNRFVYWIGEKIIKKNQVLIVKKGSLSYWWLK